MATVIIGHGISPLKKGWGKEIDKHTVVRMKDPSWQNEFDYGTRIDYLSASTEVMHSMLRTNKNPKEYWCQPKKGEWDAAMEIDFRQRCKDRAPMFILEEPFYTWNKKYLDLRPDPSAQLGFRNFSLGTFTILTVLDRLKETDVRLVGFDNLMEPDLWDYQKGDRGMWKSWHDWHTEKAMLPLFEEHYGATVTEWR